MLRFTSFNTPSCSYVRFCGSFGTLSPGFGSFGVLSFGVFGLFGVPFSGFGSFGILSFGLFGFTGMISSY